VEIGNAINECSQLSFKDKRQSFVLRSAPSLGFQLMALPLKETKLKRKKDNRASVLDGSRNERGGREDQRREF
jgi:hypothetical protein